MNSVYADGTPVKIGDVVQPTKNGLPKGGHAEVVKVLAGNGLIAIAPGPIPAVVPVPVLSMVSGNANTFEKVV